jgi:hypothetical protein
LSSFEESLYSTLTGYAGLTALVSTRVYPQVIPQGATMPLLVYTRVSTTREQAFGSGQDIVTSRPRFQFDAWAHSALEAATISEQLRACLQASSYAVTFDNEFALRDPDTGLHRHVTDAFVAHTGG